MNIRVALQTTWPYTPPPGVVRRRGAYGSRPVRGIIRQRRSRARHRTAVTRRAPSTALVVDPYHTVIRRRRASVIARRHVGTARAVTTRVVVVRVGTMKFSSACTAQSRTGRARRNGARSLPTRRDRVAATAVLLRAVVVFFFSVSTAKSTFYSYPRRGRAVSVFVILRRERPVGGVETTNRVRLASAGVTGLQNIMFIIF